MPTQTTQYLSFHLDHEDFALSIAPIREIIEYSSMTPIPMAPAFMRGVINLRGTVVPIIDLLVRFGRPQTEIGRRTCVVIVEIKSSEPSVCVPVGILVDGVNAVLDIEAAAVQPRPEFGLDTAAEFIGGMIRDDHRFIVILNLDHVLAANQVAALMGTATQTSAHAAESAGAH